MKDQGFSQRGSGRVGVTRYCWPLLSPQFTDMKEAHAQKAAQKTNNDLDAYVASVRAYLARPDSQAVDGAITQSLKSKSSDRWQDTSAAEDSRASSTAIELAKKHCTKRSS